MRNDSVAAHEASLHNLDVAGKRVEAPAKGPIKKMKLLKRFSVIAPLLVWAFWPAVTVAQETPAPTPTPTPIANSEPTPIDIQYDGRTHITLAPYLWLSTIRGSFQFSIPTLPNRPPDIVQGSVSTGPSNYLSKLNSAAMFAFDIRKGRIDLFGDFIYMNADAGGSTAFTITGPRGRLMIPVTLNTSAHVSSTIYEVAAGYTVAQTHDGDLSVFIGTRQFPIHNLSFSYNATIGRNDIITPSGSISIAQNVASDIIGGLRGKVFVHGSRYFVPYYVDFGTSAGSIANFTNQEYTGVGYAYAHGQTVVLLWRALNYGGFPSGSPIQTMNFNGPLLGYSLNL